MSNDLGIIIAALIVSGAYLGGQYLSTEREPSPSVALPSLSASELFHLRSDCRDLGQQVMNGHPASPGLSESFVAHYNPTDNRCYVKIENSSDDATTDNIDFFDGQTNEELAMWHTAANGQMTTFIFDKLRHGQSSTVSDVMDYMSQKMEGDQ